MNAEQILAGLIPVDREFMRVVLDVVQHEPLSTNLSNGLKKAMTRHGVYLFEYSRQPDKHDRALNSIMDSGNEVIAILRECVPDGKDPLISWDRRRNLEDVLISRAKWAKEHEDRRKNGVMIFDSTGKEVIN